MSLVFSIHSQQAYWREITINILLLSFNVLFTAYLNTSWKSLFNLDLTTFTSNNIQFAILSKIIKFFFF